MNSSEASKRGSIVALLPSRAPCEGPHPLNSGDHLAESWPELSRPDYHLLLSPEMRGRGTGRLPSAPTTPGGGTSAEESGSVPQSPGYRVGQVQHYPEPLLPPGAAKGLLMATVATPRIPLEAFLQPYSMLVA